MGRRKAWEPPVSEKERKIRAAITQAISDMEHEKKIRAYNAMADYRKKHDRLTQKIRAANARGMSYGYYVALCVEFRGRLSIM